MVMTKTQIRTDMKAFLATIDAENRHRRSLDACAFLVATKEFRNAQTIMMFLSLPVEVETATLAVKAWAEGKNIAVPRVDWEGQRMEPLEIKSLDVGMRTARQGVREPVDGRVVPLDSIDMVVVPGLAFDRRGYRVGRGRGFYDRFLAQRGFGGVRCALCFHEQLIEEVPREAHDSPMDLIVTDQEVLRCSSGRGVKEMRQ